MFLFFRPFQPQNVLILFLKFCVFHCRDPDLQKSVMYIRMMYIYLEYCTVKTLNFEKKRWLYTVVAVCLFVEKHFSLRLFLNCSYFLSDFSLNVPIRFVLIKKKECIRKPSKFGIMNTKRSVRRAIYRGHL